MRFTVLTFAAIAAAQSPAFAQDSQVRRGPAPDWAAPSELMPVPASPTGSVFVRRQDILVHLDARGPLQYSGYRLKILNPNALQIGNLSLDWNPASGAPTVHAIKVYRDEQVIDVLEKASFEILRREDRLEASRLDGVLTAVLRIPDLRVGDELEVAMTIPGSDPTLGRNGAGILLLSPEPSPGRYHLGLRWEQGYEPALKMAPDLAAIVQRGANAVDVRVDNPAMLAAPKDAPGRYRWQRVVEYSDFPDWAVISRHFAPLYAGAARLAPGSPLKQEAARIAAASPAPFDRASAALKLVQQDVRYVYVGLDRGNLTPATAEETWQRRYGDCKGKTALLLALLAELGIEAQPVLVNSAGADDGFDQRLPSPRLFDHVVVRAKIAGTEYWMDGTLPPVVPPGTVPVIPFEWVLPLTAQGSALEHLAWRPAKRPDEIALYDIDARAGFDQPARITQTTIARGIKGLTQQVQLSAIGHEQLIGAFRQQLVGSTWQTVDDVQWRYDPKAQASVLAISGTWAMDWDNDGNGAKSLALPGGGFSPPEKRVRPAEQDQRLPFANKPEFDCQVATVRLPSATRASNWSFKPGFNNRIFGQNYYRALELRAGTIRMVRGFRVERREIDAATAREDNARIASFDNSKAWIFYDPATKGFPESAGQRVPATDEIDWTADDVPCLASATPR